MRAAPLLLALALSGCLSLGDLPDAPPSEAVEPLAAPEPRESASRADGLLLSGALAEGDGVVSARFLATNEGAAATTRTLCESPWSFAVRDAGGRALRFEPLLSTCAGFGREPLPPGAVRATTFSWDGTLYDGESPAGRAPPGDYALVATFRAERGDAPASVTLSLPFAVEG